MTSQDRIKAVLSEDEYTIEQKGEGVQVNGFLLICPETVEVPCLVHGKRRVRGWAVWLDDGEDATMLLADRSIDPVLVKAAAFLAEWKAKDTLRRIQEQEWAEEALATQKAAYYA